jgi:anaerobic ribonucleoside-triphosphate reductase activating protein
MWPAAELAAHVGESAIDGVTISGGEPFQQLDGLIAFCAALRERGVDSILVFTGYAVAEIEAFARGAEALALIDVLVAGRYVATQAQSASILSSGNQQLKLLSTRHSRDEFTAGGEVEIAIAPDGTVTLTGFPSAGLRRAVRNMGQ